MEYAVTINNLTRKFGSFTAVDSISLDVEKGEIFGFLGANGAGKTTAIRMLCGLLLPTSGGGTVAGLDIYKESEKIKRSIGYMSQRFSLYCDLTGRENLTFYGSVYGLNHRDIKNRIDELAEYLTLSEFIDRSCASLPLGWRQRLALAAALLHRPQILFLDEPTGGVDPVFRRRFWEILYRLADQGTTLFVTTHYMDEAEFCRRISIMHRGKIIEIGNPEKLVQKYNQPDLQELFIKLITERDADAQNL
ncbi:MAG: ABC transporter ATP-binding protein [candidate division Zixibacteria bacterium HGW-Zixibacteria-1]|nr:MAG: ABC transporter ATP-binding protein [candidate division Zixibacteria bacterium HGW-Zixibacteria-1]